MKSPLEEILILDEMIRQLRKIDINLDAGQIIRAYRENGKILAFLEKKKLEIIQEEKNKKTTDNQSSSIEQIENMEIILKQLRRVDSLMYSGQIIQAYGVNNKLVSVLKRIKCEIELKETKNEK